MTMIMIRLSILFRSLCLLLALQIASSAGAAISGKELLTDRALDVKPGKKGTVLLFLSAACPCSNAHVEVIKKLAADFPDFAFAAVHSNANETPELSKKYFAAAQLPFPVVQDEKSSIADELRALKTPHAFVLSPDGKVVYKGGVTSSSSASPSDKQYLRDALSDLAEGRPLRRSETRVLGCVIARD